MNLPEVLKKYYDDNYLRNAFIYVLTNKARTHFYVGKTNKSVEERYNKGIFNKYQNKYKTYETLYVFQVPYRFLAYEFEMVVFDYLSRHYGIEYVRGAHIPGLKLPHKREISIRKKSHLNDLCYICGGKGHYAYKCPNKN